MIVMTGQVRVAGAALAFALATSFASVTSLAAEPAPSGCDVAVEARFVEGAPRDRFVLDNRSAVGWSVASLHLDLAGSAGRLVFDTEDGGAGVEVFQPLRIEAETVRADVVEAPLDGGERLALAFAAFAPGERLIFSIDVDDRLVDSALGQIRVAGAEIAGAEIALDLVHEDGREQGLDGRFGADAALRLVGAACS